MAAGVITLLVLSAASYGQLCSTYESASLVENVPVDFSGVNPVPENCGALPCATYLSAASCLGGNGPVGAWGPLGSLGPLGKSSWSPSYWISGIFSWSQWAKENLDGPLTAAGPLGPNGPLSQNAYYVTLPSINDFAKQLQARGIWTILGPIGPLGGLGPLGPLGPVGAHGYVRNNNGQYVDDNGNVQRNYSVPYPYANDSRTYELYENYDPDFAANMTDNDSSFMVVGTIDAVGDNASFPFTSLSAQFLSVLVVPTYSLDTFDISVSDSSGNVIVTSNSTLFVNWAQMAVSAPETPFVVSVTLSGSLQFLSHEYNLYVTGGTQWLDNADITGPQLADC